MDSANLVWLGIEGKFPYTVTDTWTDTTSNNMFDKFKQKPNLVPAVVQCEVGELASTGKPTSVRINEGKLLQGLFVLGDEANDFDQDLARHLKQSALGRRRLTLHHSIEKQGCEARRGEAHPDKSPVQQPSRPRT
ncbi:hypothetical protein NW760_001530 [Fusarium oxysporum]|nr:hypothetical protein NW769_005416 [Fusarium oxysporum]KAJ4241237.1 hypothetical protein NW760_001530 [Fusarium oxysporum]WKT51222.1 hypothetical protein QSH57_016192 [Fusarium oxysporum f. sp. vasinfectum]